MIAQIAIKGVGPCADVTYDLDPRGPTTITGPSETGKSTLLLATTLALWGTAPDGTPFPTEAIRDGQDRCEVEITTARGTVVRRSITRKRSTVRAVEREGEPYICPTEDSLRAQLGPVGSRAELARAILVPQSWVPMAQQNLGRPLRDLVLSLLPPADLRAVIGDILEAGGHTLREGDPLVEKDAKSLLTAANANRDQAQGRLQAAHSRADNCGRPAEAAPAPDERQAASATLAHAAAHADHQRRVDAYQAEQRRVADAATRRDQYRAQVAALGAEPPVDAAALQAGRKYIERLDKEGLELNAAYTRASAAAASAEAAVTAARAHPGVCPACEQALPEHKRPDLGALSDAANEAESAARGAQKALEARREERRQAGEKLRELEVAERKRGEWQAARQAIGAEPAVPAPPSVPAAPGGEAPSTADVQAARDLLARAERAAGAAAQHERESAAARKELEAAEAASKKATDEAARVKILLDACRRAPTEIASRQAEALGDMGPVALRFPPKETSTTPEIEVLVDGRPWWLASTGKLVLADLHLRAALRRLAGLQALPLVVDRAQDWSGDWPEIDGPVVYLVTRAGDVSVSCARPGEAA